MRVPRVIHARSAFTLIELVISAALMSIILAAGYACLTAGISSQKVIDRRSEALQTARAAVNLIAADLRSAVPLSKEYEFVGMRRELGGSDADNLDFATRNYTPRKAREFDFCETSYFVQKEPASGSLVLYRRRDPTPDPEPLAGGSREEIARGVHGFRLEYYDGFEWYDEWGDPNGKSKTKLLPEPNMSGLPEAVRITLSIDPPVSAARDSESPPEETPVVLQTIARLNMAQFFYQSSGGTNNGASSSPEGSPQQAAPGGPQ